MHILYRLHVPRRIVCLMLLSGVFASSQEAPASLWLGPPLQLPAAGPGTTESPLQHQLFDAVPLLPLRPPAMPTLPRAAQPSSANLTSTAVTGVSMQSVTIPADSTRLTAAARPPETPLSLQRRPSRNLAAGEGERAFILRSTFDAGVSARISLAFQNAIWHADNFSNAPRRRTIDETITEWRPILRIELGTPPASHSGTTSGTEYYCEIEYAPTFHTIIDSGTTTLLHRLSGDVGRASQLLRTSLHFEYDDNTFGAQGDSTAEESSRNFRLSPLIEYNLTSKTTLRAEGTRERITSGGGITDRTDYILDAGITSATSAKTTLGLGTELGYIIFDLEDFGVHNYQQAYVSADWRATRKIRFQTRIGVEFRKFDSPTPKSSRVSAVTTTILNWLPDERTRVNLGFRVRNQPSVSLRGTTFQEIRVGADASHELPSRLYLRGEATVSDRKYDSGDEESEITLRPAFGYHTDHGRLFDNLNVEFYYQFRRLNSNRTGADQSRNLFGIETTLIF